MFDRGLNNLAWLEALTQKSSIITDGLNGKFDPADSASYNGSGTTWTNLITGDDDGGDLYLGNSIAHTGTPRYFLFDGSDDFVGNVASTGYSDAVEYNLDPSDPNFTISFWFYSKSAYPLANQTSQLFSLGSVDTRDIGTLRYGLAMTLSETNKLTLWTVNEDGEPESVEREATDAIGRSIWNHITVVKEQATSTLRIYVNGKYQHMSNTNETKGNTDLYGTEYQEEPIQFGRAKVNSDNYDYTPQWDRIGMILMYNTRALKKSEIMSNFLSERSHYGY